MFRNGRARTCETLVDAKSVARKYNVRDMGGKGQRAEQGEHKFDVNGKKEQSLIGSLWL